MNPVFKQWLLSLLTRLLVIVIIANIISLTMLWFLPGEGVEYFSTKSTQAEYHRYRVAIMIEKHKAGSDGKRAGSASKDGSYQSGPGGSSAPAKKIPSLVLTGLYGTDKAAIIVIAMKSSPTKTEVVGTGEEYSGYTLMGVDNNSAIFDRNGQEYRLYLQDADKAPVYTPTKPMAENDFPDSADMPTTRVSREEVVDYAKNMDRIWKDISIIEVKENGTLKGFKVTRIKPDTPLARLGLKRGDIIIKANNKRIRSYADALDIYKKIGSIQALQLVVLRNDQEKELVYEIY